MIQLSGDSGVRATECRSGQRTGLSSYNTAFTLTLFGCLKRHFWYRIHINKKKGHHSIMVEPDSTPLDNQKLRELWACGYSFQRHATQGKTQMFGNMCDIWDSAHICTLDRLTKCAHSHALFQISIGTNQRRAACDISLWRHVSCCFILRLWTSEPGLQPLLIPGVCTCEYSNCCSLCTFQRCGRTTESRERGRMRAHCCGRTRLLLSCDNWRVWLQVLWAKIQWKCRKHLFVSVIAFHLKINHEVSTVPSGLRSETHFRVIIRL